MDADDYKVKKEMNEKEAHTISRLDERLKKHGYALESITHLKNRDNLTFGNDKIKITVKLRKKISEIDLETLVEACIGEKE